MYTFSGFSFFFESFRTLNDPPHAKNLKVGRRYENSLQTDEDDDSLCHYRATNTAQYNECGQLMNSVVYTDIQSECLLIDDSSRNIAYSN